MDTLISINLSTSQ